MTFVQSSLRQLCHRTGIIKVVYSSRRDFKMQKMGAGK